MKVEGGFLGKGSRWRGGGREEKRGEKCRWSIFYVCMNMVWWKLLFFYNIY